MSETEQSEVAEAAVVVEEPVAEAASEAVAPEAVAAEEEAPAGILQGKVYLCERGHRTTALWNTPTVCRAHTTRSNECGRPLYGLSELPDQIQKALNPLKASKKGSRKG